MHAHAITAAKATAASTGRRKKGNTISDYFIDRKPCYHPINANTLRRRAHGEARKAGL